MIMSRKAKVTESRFKAVKILLASGAKHNECAESMGLSACTIGMINRSETFEEYRNNMYATSGSVRRKKKEAEAVKAVEDVSKPDVKEDLQRYETPSAQVVEYRQNVTIQATHYMMEEMRKANELLTTISAKLAFIVDELTK